MFRKDIVIPSGAVALALCVFSIQADPLKPTQYGDFDRYVLALSRKPDFARAWSNVTVTNRKSVACKREQQQNRFSDRPRLMASIAEIDCRSRSG